jgi:hypothetical protein
VAVVLTQLAGPDLPHNLGVAAKTFSVSAKFQWITKQDKTRGLNVDHVVVFGILGV